MVLLDMAGLKQLSTFGLNLLPLDNYVALLCTTITVYLSYPLEFKKSDVCLTMEQQKFCAPNRGVAEQCRHSESHLQCLWKSQIPINLNFLRSIFLAKVMKKWYVCFFWYKQNNIWFLMITEDVAQLTLSIAEQEGTGAATAWRHPRQRFAVWTAKIIWIFTSVRIREMLTEQMLSVNRKHCQLTC